MYVCFKELPYRYMQLIKKPDLAHLDCQTCTSRLWNGYTYIWALMGENEFDPCEQQRCRLACASAQSGLHLCYSFSEKYKNSFC